MLKLALPALVFSAFLTETKFVPGLRNNIGPFEILGWLVALGFLLVHRRTWRHTPATNIVGAIVLVAAFSLVNLAAHRFVPAMVQLAVLLFLWVFLVSMYNLCLTYRVSPGYLLLLVTLSAAIIGPWIVLGGLQSQGDVAAVGPFRNRVHMGNYMLTAFWMVLMYAFWPNRHRFKRVFCAVAIFLTLYAVSISGRRSLYLSLFIGLAGLSASFLVARGRRAKMIWIAVFVVASLGGLYRYGGDLLPRLDFFRDRVVMVDDRLRSALGLNQDDAMEKSFLMLQREGVMRAFRDHPLIGIGWAGFGRTEYSPTGHEVHSTPLRFLAETGLTGLTLYAGLMLYLLWRSVQMTVRMRASPYGATYLIQAIALWSLSVSYLYNRHLTERTFYLFLAVFLVMEAFAAFSRQQALPRGDVPTNTQRNRGFAPLRPAGQRPAGAGPAEAPPTWS